MLLKLPSFNVTGIFCMVNGQNNYWFIAAEYKFCQLMQSCTRQIYQICIFFAPMGCSLQFQQAGNMDCQSFQSSIILFIRVNLNSLSWKLKKEIDNDHFEFNLSFFFWPYCSDLTNEKYPSKDLLGLFWLTYLID